MGKERSDVLIVSPLKTLSSTGPSEVSLGPVEHVSNVNLAIDGEVSEKNDVKKYRFCFIQA